MKRYFLLLLVLMSTIAYATSYLDNRSRAIAFSIKYEQSSRYKTPLKGIKSVADEALTLDSLYYPVIMKLANDSVIDDLLSLGSVIFHKRENFILASVPFSQLDTISRLPLVNRMTLSAPLSATLDSAREMTGVNKIHSGLELPQAYNGEGVIVGVSDIGFDPSHVAFNDGRLKRVVCYDELRARRYDMSTPQEISSWATDDSTQWHACHVAGILAGNYRGNPYYGVATGADMVVTTSNLYDMAILAGVEDIIATSKREGKPAVVNLSLGNYTGPHDGTSLFNQYLDLLGKEAVICLSSGNNGDNRVYIPFDVENDGDELKTFVYDYPDVNGIALDGAIDLWSADSREFLVALTIYDRNTNSVVYTSPFVGAPQGGASSWGIASPALATGNDISIPLFENDLSGTVRIYSSLNLENNRYNVYATVDVENRQRDESGRLGRYCIGFIVKGDKGSHIDAYSNASSGGVVFRSLGVDGFTNGTHTCSISDLACGYNVIAVGASNSRNSANQVNGQTVNYNFNTRETAYFSGYGTLEDGRVLPHFCAPGNMVVAPINSCFTTLMGDESLQRLAAKASVEGKDYYWVADCGTSMASPHAAGIIACWLQADPSLSVHEVVDIAQSTASIEFADYPNPKWGAGNIDAYAGLKEVLSRSGVGNVSVANTYKMILKPVGYKQFEVDIPFSKLDKLSVYSASGQLVYSSSLTHIDVSVLSSGIYILTATHTHGIATARIIVN